MGRKVKQRRHRKLDLTKTKYKATSCEDASVDASTLAEVKEANKEIMEKKSKKSRKYDNNKDLPVILERDVCFGFVEHAGRPLAGHFNSKGMCYCCMFYDINNGGGCTYHHVELDDNGISGKKVLKYVVMIQSVIIAALAIFCILALL
jgi:hypothetical protein